MQSFLRGIPLFANLSDDDIERLVQITAEMRVSAGVCLFTEGSAGKYFFVIQEGAIEIFTRTGEEEVSLAIRKPGEIIGELSLLDKLPRMATARAICASKLLLMPREEFDRLLEASPSVARTILYTIIPRWRDTESALRQQEQKLREQARELEQTLSALQSTNEKLERRVAERTAELEKLNTHLRKQVHVQAPVLLTDKVIMFPLRGNVEASHQQHITDVLLRGIAQYQADTVIVDINGVPRKDKHLVQVVVHVAQAAQQQGCTVILTGIGAQVAPMLAEAGADVGDMVQCATLLDGVLYVSQQRR